MRFPASISLFPRAASSVAYLAASLTLPLLLAACSKADDGGTTVRETVTTRDVDIAGMVSTHEESRTTERIDRPEPAETSRPRPQSGQLTAGDADDLLNADQYAAYAGRFLQSDGGDLPFVDPRRRVTVKVLDARHQPVANAHVSIARKAGALDLVSAADGTASFFPVYDGIAGQARIKVSAGAGSATRTLTLGDKAPQTVTLTLSGQGAAVHALDLLLVLDATGSMGDEMHYLQAELDGIVARLKGEAGQLDLRIGLIVYRDHGDAYVTRDFPLTGDIAMLRDRLAAQEADGGGDMPEAVDAALAQAGRMAWRPDAAKALLLIADAPPHRSDFGAAMDAAEQLRLQGVHMVPVAASGVEDSAQYLMRTMAVLTQGRYIFLTDDSGIGNGHAEPDVACYVVTRLDQLIARVLAGLVEGRRIEPGRDEVIRMVGDYDAGRCRATEGPSNS